MNANQVKNMVTRVPTIRKSVDLKSFCVSKFYKTKICECRQEKALICACGSPVSLYSLLLLLETPTEACLSLGFPPEHKWKLSTRCALTTQLELSSRLSV